MVRQSFTKILPLFFKPFLIKISFLTGMFMTSWLPYGIVCIFRVFWDSKHLTPFLSTLPAMFAKSSLVWTPLFYILLNKKIKEAFLNKVGVDLKVIVKHAHLGSYILPLSLDVYNIVRKIGIFNFVIKYFNDYTSRMWSIQNSNVIVIEIYNIKIVFAIYPRLYIKIQEYSVSESKILFLS